MTPCFADTSYFVALLSPGDANHARAHEIAGQLRRSVLTSEYVIVEVGNFFRAPAARGRFKNFMSVVESDENTQIIPASSVLLRRAIELFVRRRDKTWSLTDCTSFVIMRDHRLTDALTSDRHFDQAGFVAMLRSAKI